MHGGVGFGFHYSKNEKNQRNKTMKNVGFINSPSEFLIDQRVFVSLGILRVATQIENIHNVKFLDLSNQVNYNKLIENFIKNNNLQYVCFSSTTPQINIVYKFCKFIKNKFKNIKIILGGPHVTLTNASMETGTLDIKKICYDHINILLKYIDTIVIGDGEYAIHYALLLNKNIINAEKTKELYLPNNYDAVAIANREFLDLNSYHFTIEGKKATNLISQSGCPYQCGFCSGRSKTFNPIRKRTIPNVIKEIDILYKRNNYQGFMFYDDEINLNKIYFENLLLELIKYQKDNNIQFNFRAYTRSDLLDNYQAKLMYEAGFRWLLIGFESGSDRILRNINKGCTVEDNTKVFDVARKNNLKIKALMSIGHPGETHETINETTHWLKKVKPEETDITIIAVYPGSHYFNKSVLIGKNLLKYTDKKTNDNLYIKSTDFLKCSNFYKSKSDEYVSFVYTDFLSDKEIVNQRLFIEKEIKMK
jgi:radical SAM superfamily enzyme YgiQ (UPF0313 family)